MEYEELFAAALQGRSVNRAAHEWGIPQKTLQQYSKGRVPDWQTGLILSREANVPANEVMAIIARLEARKKPRSLFPDLGYQVAGVLVSVNLFLTSSPSEAAPILKIASQTIGVMSNAARKFCQSVAKKTKLRLMHPRRAT